MQPVYLTGGKASNKRLRYSQSMSAIMESREHCYNWTIPSSTRPCSSSQSFSTFDHHQQQHEATAVAGVGSYSSSSLCSSAQPPVPFKMPRSPTRRKRRQSTYENLFSFFASLSITKQKRPSYLVMGTLLIVSFLSMSNIFLQIENTSSWLRRTSESDHQAGGASTTSLTTTLSSVATPLIRPISHSIPLPLPKEKVSVVLMNFSRPRMIRDSSMMRTLLSHPNVDEVLLLHANPKTAFEFVHPKVVNIDAIEYNDEMGLSLRFYFCQLAKNNWVVHVDDDMEFTPAALNELFIEFGRNPRRIVGRFGRDLTPGNSFNGYNSKDTHKSTEVVLTKLMVMERDTCGAFFEYAHLVWDDVVLKEAEGPLWNGEDIFMSLVANHVYGSQPQATDDDNGHEFNNFAMDWLDVWQADDSLKDYDGGKLDISGGLKGYRFWEWVWWQTLLRRNRHYSYRGNLWTTARDRLTEVDDIPQKKQE